MQPVSTWFTLFSCTLVLIIYACQIIVRVKNYTVVGVKNYLRVWVGVKNKNKSITEVDQVRPKVFDLVFLSDKKKKKKKLHKTEINTNDI